MSQPVTKPIFLVGTGRCGSMLLYRMMAEHPHVMYPTAILDVFPKRVFWNRLGMYAKAVPLLGRPLRNPLKAWEGFNFWEYHTTGLKVPGGFSIACRDLRADDVLEHWKPKLHRIFSRMLTAKRHRLLTKLPGWTRVGFYKEIFPDAKIVHLIRQPHAVVNSLMKMEWWHGWHGPAKWRWGPLTDEEETIWKRYDESFVVLGAIEWKKVLEAYWRSLERLTDEARADCTEIRYAQLCEDTEGTMKQILAFCQLDDTPSFQRARARTRIVSQNEKWKRDFTPKQQEQLVGALEDLQWRKYYDGPDAASDS